MPKVSVIVPVYGVEKYIERCARCLFEQTMDDIEFIFVNDCTKDQSINILQRLLFEYPQRKSQTKIVHHEVNKGLPIARQTGIKVATGEYLAHCDSDDWLATNAYSTMYNKAINDNADIVICDYYKANDNIKQYIKGCNVNDKDILIKDSLTERISWSVWNKIIKTSIYRDNSIVYPKDNMGEDMALIMQLILKAQKISYVSQPLYYYFYNPNSISHLPSVDAVFKRYQHLYNNTKIVLSSFKDNGIELDYKVELQLLKWYVRRCIWPITHDNDYRAIWRDTFPEIFPSILFSQSLKISDKLRIILTYLHIYPQKYNN